EEMAERMDRIHGVLGRIFSCPKPGVAAIAGYAAGGGANLALACDLVVMADDARFAELFVKRGLVMDMSGTFTLPRAVGLHRAKELALLGDTIDAQRAYAFGIANRVVPAGDLVATAEGLAERLAAGPPIALARMKQALNASFSQTFDEALDQESIDQSAVFQSADVAEAIQAFFEKREPRFTGE
ncbi:MAG: enoyl-CoA hydratase/isomerase family protein, partial [Actinomycetota bacterium]